MSSIVSHLEVMEEAVFIIGKLKNEFDCLDLTNLIGNDFNILGGCQFKTANLLYINN